MSEHSRIVLSINHELGGIQNEAVVPAICLEVLSKITKSSVSIAGSRTEISTQNFSNKTNANSSTAEFGFNLY
jgi:hypothetical protein